MIDTCQNDWRLSKLTSPQLINCSYITKISFNATRLIIYWTPGTSYWIRDGVSYLWCFLELNGEKDVLLLRLEMLLDGLLLSSVASSTFNCGIIWPPTVQAIFLDCSCKVHLTSREMESSPQDEMRTGGAVCGSGRGLDCRGWEVIRMICDFKKWHFV